MRIFETSIGNAKLVCYVRSEAHIDQGADERHIAPRPFMLVIPGGGYQMVCEREAEPMALAFLNEGYNVAVLYYSVDPAVFPTALTEAARAISYIRDHAAELNAQPDHIHVCGASAGGHLATSLGVFWNTPMLAELTGLTATQMQPNALVLAYPVITSGEKAHRNSFLHLLQERAEDPEMLDLVSLENHVTDAMPPTFVWATRTDTYVPVENSLLLAAAMQRAGICYELHIYPYGEHGSGLCTEETIMTGDITEYAYMAGWFSEAVRFLKKF